MSKVLLMSHTFPPLINGVSFILTRLFNHFPKDSYVVYTTPYKGEADSASRKLPCQYYYAPAHSIHNGYSRWLSIKEWLDVLPMVLYGLKIIKKEKINSILAFSEVGNFLLSAYILHKITRIPLSIYFFDCYSVAQTKMLRKYFAKPIERWAVKSATNIFVMSEALQDYYQSKYGVASILLPHPVDTDDYYNVPKVEGNKRDRVKIVYTGMIYDAHYDSILNLIKAIRNLQNIEFHIYSRKSFGELEKKGICGRNVIYHGLIKQREAAKVQASADILFLPLAFKSPYPDIIRTASPGKLPEYLASGRPILVHAPPDSYISWYARKYGWGYVVDKSDPDQLKNAVLRVINDNELQLDLINNALETATLHSSKRVAGILMGRLGI